MSSLPLCVGGFVLFFSFIAGNVYRFLFVWFQEEFCALGARLVVVSFGVREGAERWLQDMQCPFPMMLDGQRQVRVQEKGFEQGQ